MSIFPTITQFSNINLMNGQKLREPFFYMSRGFRETPSSIKLGRGIAIDKVNSTLNIGSKKIPIRRFAKTFYDESMQLHKDIKLLNFTGTLNVIYMSNYNAFLVLDEDTYNSLYIQLMVLEEYDKSLFEKVIFNPNVKVYKLKI
jgi:undecaprenyl-diphosphooligosaccharide---protein glycotransferase